MTSDTRLATKAPPSEATVTCAYDLDSHLIGVSDTSTNIAAPAASASFLVIYPFDFFRAEFSIAKWAQFNAIAWQMINAIEPVKPQCIHLL